MSPRSEVDELRQRHTVSRARFRTAFGAGTDALLTDGDGIVVDVLGPTMERLAEVGRCVVPLPEGIISGDLTAAIRRVLGGDDLNLTVDVADEEGTPLEARVLSVRSDDGARTFVVIVLTARVGAAELARLRRSDRIYDVWFDQAPNGVCFVGLDGAFLRANPAYCTLVGRSEAELLSLRFAQITHPDDVGGDIAVLNEFIAGSLERHQSDKRYLRPDGATVWVHRTLALLRDERGEAVHFISMIDDITERVVAQERLRAALDFARSTFDSTPVGMAELALDGTILRANAVAGQLLGSGVGELAGRNVVEFAAPGEAGEATTALAQLAADEIGTVTSERRVTRPNGEQRWFSVHAASVPGPDGRPERLVMQIVDISDQKHHTATLAHAAGHDTLTGLANRRRLHDLLRAELDRLAPGEHLAVLFVDLVGFKAVNDRLGHAQGDRTLVAVADALSSSVRDSDHVARLGGDEFVVVIPRTTDGITWSIVGRVHAAVAECTPEGPAIAATIGISYGSRDASVKDLLRRADADMYRQRGVTTE